MIIGSFSNKEILTGDIRCLIDYSDDGDVGIEHVSYKVVPNRNTIFLYKGCMCLSYIPGWKRI